MEKRKCNFFIYFVALSINFICFSIGTAYTWTSPLLPIFESDDQSINPIGRPITPSESGLLVSIINLGLLSGPLFSGLVVGRIGKKWTLLISGVPLVAAHVICFAANTVEVFLVARYLMGLGTGSAWALLPGYVSEIAEPGNRGALSSFMVILNAIGGLFTYVTGPFVSVKWFSIINLIPGVIFLILVYFFVPESPYDLVMKNRISDAKKSLMKLRQSTNVEKEIFEIERIIELNSKSNAKLSQMFTNKVSANALLICTSLMVFNAFSGILIVLGYTQTIFELAGSSMPPAYSAIMVGIISVIATLCNSQLIDRLGRKPLLIIASSTGCISQGVLGIFFNLHANGVNTQSFGWLPICSVVLFMFSYNFALGSLPWVILGELFASNVKAAAATICATLNFGLGFIITFAYPYLVGNLGIANTFLIFSFMLALNVIFSVLKVPETKGKSFEEIFVLLGQEK